MYRLTKKELVDAISIPIMALTKNVILSHRVKLSRPNQDGSRDYYHKEFSYRSRYNSIGRVSTLRLSHSSILILEDRNGENNDSLIVNITNRDFIVKSLSLMKKIMKMDNLFVEHGDRFIVNPKLRKDVTIAFEAYRHKVVTASPCIIINEENEPVEGVSISLDSRSVTRFEVTVDMFKTLLKTIKKFDFHTAGLAAITYLQAAEIGKYEIEFTRVNLLDFEGDYQPVRRTKGTVEDDIKNTLETRPPSGAPLKNKGW